MKNLKTICLCFLIASFLIGCSDPKMETINAVEDNYIYNEEGTIRYNGDFLEFSSPESFESTKQFIHQASEEEISGWLGQFEFESLQLLFEKALEAEINFLEKSIESRTSNSEILLSENRPDAIQNIECKINFFSDGTIEGLKIFHPELAYLVNKDGIVKVAGHLIQYNEYNLKVISGGTSDEAVLFEDFESTNEKQGVYVSDVAIQGDANARTGFSQSKTATNFEKRIEASVSLITYKEPVYGSTKVCTEECLKPGRPCQVFCDYPIIRWNSVRSVLKVYAKFRKIRYNLLYPGWENWTAQHYYLNARYKINGSKRSYSSLCSSNGATLGRSPRVIYNKVLYDGSAKDFTSLYIKVGAVDRNPYSENCSRNPSGFPGYEGWFSHSSIASSPEVYFTF